MRLLLPSLLLLLLLMIKTNKCSLFIKNTGSVRITSSETLHKSVSFNCDQSHTAQAPPWSEENENVRLQALAQVLSAGRDGYL